MVDIVIKQRPMVDNATPSEKHHLFSYLSHIIIYSNSIKVLPTLIITFMAQKETITVCNNNNDNVDDNPLT